eukprot:10371593-Alexandrium_andersonii.AAC.1
MPETAACLEHPTLVRCLNLPGAIPCIASGLPIWPWPPADSGIRRPKAPWRPRVGSRHLGAVHQVALPLAGLARSLSGGP